LKKIIIGITGASGSVYALRLIEELYHAGHDIHIICSETGAEVFEYELGMSPESFVKKLKTGGPLPVIHQNSNLFSPPASGSFKADAMVIVPCSMASLGGMASGSLQSLLGRSADVCLKEKRTLIVAPRETPLNQIHLRNMLSLSEAGAIILPAMPGFYNHPASVDDIVNFTVSRILDQLGIENNLIKRWDGR
jgi:4-hydroxy-3-polyprenylbenzoate decarboxylase